MSKRKLSKSDFAALNAGRPISVIRPGGRTQLRMQGPPRTRKKGGR